MAPVTSRALRALRNPLLHFTVLGGLLFVAHGAVTDPPDRSARDSIIVGPETERQLVSAFTATWQRPPTHQELDALVEDWIVEEAFVREAIALGLDRGDAVVRQRLRQKMTFIAESSAGFADPDEATLREHYAAHPERFGAPAQVAFDQLFLGEDPDQATVAAMRAALADGTAPAMLGNPTLLPRSVRLAVPSAVDGTFGQGFFEALAEAPDRAWTGPVASSYGLHLVRVRAREPARTIPFEAARERVALDWKARRAQELRDGFTEALLSRYRIVRPDSAALLGE